jgi:tyrosine-protein kinase Etk/Wzc
MNTTSLEQTKPSLESQPQALDDDEISLLDLAIVLAKHKTLIIGLPAIVAVLAIIVSLMMTPQFTATAKMLPPEKSQGASALMAQLGGLAGLAGGAAGIKNPNDLYIGMMKSRTLLDAMIKRFDLMTLWEAKLESAARERLAGMSVIASGKDSIITIEVTDEDPKRAADIANAYIDELYKLTKSMATTEASRRRLLFEQQFKDARVHLANSEMAAKQGLEKGGVVKVDDQGRTMVETSARLRGQVTVKEVQIGAMQSYAAPGNPELKMAQQELAVLKNELARTEGSNLDKRANGNVSNAQGFANLNLLRDLKYYETIYELLARQYEMAKLDEAKDSAIIQVMDAAIPPDRKSKPKRAQIVLLATLAAGFVAVLLAFVIEALGKASSDPAQNERMRVFREYLRSPLRFGTRA